MKNPQQIRMLTINFSVFQGLKQVPLGLLLFVISLWSSAQSGLAKDILFPVGCSLVFFYLYWLVHQFYTQIFGTVILTNKQRLFEWIRGIIGAIAALVAFWVDVSQKLSFSLLGLVFASAFLVEYMRITRQVKERILLFYPAAALLLILLSVLPFLGINWWNPLGIKALLLGVCTVAGVLFTVLGIITHISLEISLMQAVEQKHE